MMLAALRKLFDPLRNTVEASKWLRAYGERCTLAGNRFQSTEEALQFVESLYKAGAEAVAIPLDRIRSEPWRIEREGGPYADALLIKLPADKAKRQAVWCICDREYATELDDWELSATGYTPSRGVVHLRWS
jgi:hypothetical protein